MSLLQILRSRFTRSPHSARVYVDGAILSDMSASGLAAVVIDHYGQVTHWWSQAAGPLTCNQAEYRAAILALENLIELGVREVDLFSDSQVMVNQMTGKATARSEGLRKAQLRLRQIATGFKRVSFHHIPREKNRLADALAYQAICNHLEGGSHLPVMPGNGEKHGPE